MIVNVVVVVEMLVIVITLVTIIIANNTVHNNHCQLSQQYQQYIYIYNSVNYHY